MSLENKRSVFSTKTSFESTIRKNFSKFGSVYKYPNPVPDIERRAAVVDDGSKSKINKTIPVEEIHQEVPVKNTIENKLAPVVNPIKKEEIKQPIVDNTVKTASSGSKSVPKF